MQDQRAYLAEQIVRAVQELGYPAEFGMVIADQLGGEWSLQRMLGYLRGAHPRSAEEIADELVAILDDRARIVEKMRSEHAQAEMTRFYNRSEREE